MVTLDYQVVASANDGYIEGSTFNNSGSYLYAGCQVDDVDSFFARFLAVTIPAGSTINVAYISVYYSDVLGTPPTCQLYFDDSATPTAPTSVSSFNAKTKTTNHVSFIPPSSGTWKNSGSLVAIIQELVDSYDYSSGAAMQLLCIGSGSGDNTSRMYSYNYTGNVRGPKLHIEYTAPASSYSGGFGRGIGRGIMR